MSKRVRDIYQLYKNLGYEIDKWEALKKISIFSRNLKFKDNDDFLDRFSTAINIIENNVSLFTSASSHVDIINTILEFLHTVNIQLTFNHDDCDVDEIVIIYMMCIVYADPQIPSFLRTALIDNSRLNHVNQAFMNILCSSSVYNLFYNGEWTEPVKNTYWIHNDNTYAQATKEDVSRCIKSAEEAFNKWRFLSIASRKDILKNLASTLECNGKFLLADTVEKCIKLVNFNNPVQCRGRLEVTNMYAPRGIVGIIHENEVKLFEYLASALILGNCAIVICNKNSCNVASYFNMFSTAEIPAGVINLLLNRNICEYHKGFNLKLDNLIESLTFTNSIIFPLIQFF